jgi:serine/threonine-protein kinase PknG
MTTERSSASVSGALPSVEESAPDSQVVTDAAVPESHRDCGTCGNAVGRGQVGRPALTSGFCQRCGAPFSFDAKLQAGDRLGKYEVVGPLGHGGVGWVYLARDLNLDGDLVALKGLINENDPRSAAAAVNEKKHLIDLRHEHIVRIRDFVVHESTVTAKPIGYIVMEYVGGKSLQKLKRLAHAGIRPFAGDRPLIVDDVIRYGIQILDALAYLHDQGLVYCDLKPDNVIHQHRKIKLIDLGAACEVGFRGDVWVTENYTVPRAERKARGMQADMDLFSLGRTLRALLTATVDGASGLVAGGIGAGVASLGLALDRATESHWQRRFASAAEMRDQLDAILHQIVALRGVDVSPRQSARFAVTAKLLDDGLGREPSLDRWTRVPAGDDVVRTEVVADGRPDPRAVALALPPPLPHPDDSAASFLAGISTADPRRLLVELDRFDRPSPEIELARARAQLALGQPADARRSLKIVSAGDPAADDWRVLWCRALLALYQADLPLAERLFDDVRRILPGELVPRLAVGYCLESQRDPVAAATHYHLVWRADHNQAGAAFGLARTCLAQRDRNGAVRALDQVRPLSRHFDAARIAAVQVLAGRVDPNGAPVAGLPGAADLADAVHRLESTVPGSGMRRDHTWLRLATVVRQAALDLVRCGPPAAILPLGDVLGDDVTERGLRCVLEQSFRDLADQADTDDRHDTLVDLANTVRPTTPW